MDQRSTETESSRAVSPTRRAFLRGVGGVLAVAAVGPAIARERPAESLQIALADRGMGMRQALGGFAVAREAGAAGLEVDFARLGGRSDLLSRLTTSAGRRQFVDSAHLSGIRISSLAFSAWAEPCFAGHPRITEYTNQFVHALAQMAVPVGVLPIGGRDALADSVSRRRLIEQLTAAVAEAEHSDVVLAIDADLPARDIKRLLNDVGSPAVQACVSVESASAFNEAFSLLGANRIAQVRFRYDELTNQSAALAAVRNTCASAGWCGWIVIDRPATSAGHALGDASMAVRRLTEAFGPAYA